MHLVRLLDQQIADAWPVIKYAVEQSVPPIAGESPEKMNNVLESLLLGKLQCWVTADSPEIKQFRTVLTTRINTDDTTGTKTLLIFSMFSFVPQSSEDIDQVHKTLVAFAKGNGCNRMLAYTQDENVLSIGRKYGMTTEWTMLTLDV